LSSLLTSPVPSCLVLFAVVLALSVPALPALLCGRESREQVSAWKGERREGQPPRRPSVPPDTGRGIDHARQGAGQPHSEGKSATNSGLTWRGTHGFAQGGVTARTPDSPANSGIRSAPHTAVLRVSICSSLLACCPS
jgi:hypothetical protein